MEGGGRAVLAIVSSVIGLAIISVILSSRAQTSQVIAAGGNALSSVIGAATGPVTGATTSSGALGGGLNLSGLGSLAGNFASLAAFA